MYTVENLFNMEMNQSFMPVCFKVFGNVTMPGFARGVYGNAKIKTKMTTQDFDVVVSILNKAGAEFK